MMSLEYAHQHPDPSSSDTPPSTPSDNNPHARHPSTKRRTRPSTGTGADTGDNHDTDSHHHHRRYRSSSGRFLARMMERDDRDSKKMSTLLLVTNERLEGETVRANEAERKASELVRRFRDIIQGKDLALQEMARVKEELGLYKIQFENAQREIFRAQESFNQVTKEKHDAEEEAARARTTARKLQEEKLVMMAREEGRRQGFEEGLSRGRRIGFEEGRAVDYVRDGPQRADYNEEGDEGDAESIEIRQARTPENRRTQRTPVVAPRPLRPPARNRSSNTYDTAPLAATLPVPTVVTPVSVSTIGRARRSPTSRTPAPVPVPTPSQTSEYVRPIPIRNSMPSPVPHSTHILQDGFIPDLDQNSLSMNIPPPHELSIPVPSPQGSEQSLPPLPPSRSASERDVFGPTVLSRDFAYPKGGGPEQGHDHGVPRVRTTSTTSRGSTRISQYDLVSPPRGSHRAEGSSRYGTQSPRSVTNLLHAAVEDPRGDNYYDRERSRTPRRNSRGRNEEVSPTQRIVEDWRSANPPDTHAATPSASGYNNRAQSPNHFQSPGVSGGPTRPSEVPVQPRAVAQVQAQARQDTSRPQSPLDRLFRRRNQGRTHSSSTVPEISIEPPSGSPSDASVATVTHPNLLSPDGAVREMPLPGDDELNEFVDANPHLLPQSNPRHPIVLPDNQLPFGFVPLSGPTTVMMASRSQTPRLNDPYAAPMLPTGLPYPAPYSRPSTSFEPARVSPNPYASPTSRPRKMSLGSASSPAPLQRPISLFSDDA